MLEAAAALFETRHPGIHIELVPGLGTTGAVQATARGQIDFGIGSRALKSSESNLNLTAEPWYGDAIVLAANPACAATYASVAQILELYAGAVSSCRQLGGSSEPVRFITRELDDAETERVVQYVPGLSSVNWSAGLVMVGSDVEKLHALAAHPGAISFVALVPLRVSGMAFDLVPVEDLVYPRSSADLASYPLRESFHLIRPATLGPEAQEFYDFLLGPEGDALYAERMGDWGGRHAT
jgi:phosphate transport system substrate-binding protein